MVSPSQYILFNQIIINGTPTKFRLFNNYDEYVRQKHIRTNIDNTNSNIPHIHYSNYGLYNTWIKCGRNPNKPSEKCIGDNTLCNTRIRNPDTDTDAPTFWSGFTWDELTFEERKLWETLGFTREIWHCCIFGNSKNLEPPDSYIFTTCAQPNQDNNCSNVDGSINPHLPPSFSTNNDGPNSIWTNTKTLLGF